MKRRGVPDSFRSAVELDQVAILFAEDVNVRVVRCHGESIGRRSNYYRARRQRKDKRRRAMTASVALDVARMTKPSILARVGTDAGAVLCLSHSGRASHVYCSHDAVARFNPQQLR
jgi:hypothetical protein